MSSKYDYTHGLPPYGLLWVVAQTVLLTLKLAGSIPDVSWFWVLTPCWVVGIFEIAIWSLVAITLFIASKRLDPEKSSSLKNDIFDILKKRKDNED